MSPLEYYKRKEIQKEILNSSKDREVAIRFNEGFGKRPDILQYENDILEAAKQGATSFHISEEHWSNPLSLDTGMSKQQLDQLRTGWDLIIDIDAELEHSKITAYYLIEVLKDYDVHCSIKFSGNHGFHIAIPYKAFPKKINYQETRLMFPDLQRNISCYLKDTIRDVLSVKILQLNTIEEIKKISGRDESYLIKNGKFDPFSVIELDTVLISSRHMFRSPYSLNEKSGLVSLPIQPTDILKFDRSWAIPEKAKVELHYLEDNKVKEEEATQLFDQAHYQEKKYIKEEVVMNKKYEEIKEKINQELFPPCIKNCLNGLKSDGRKRSVFILINFLRKIGWSFDEIKTLLTEWNKKNYEPLKEGYIISQISWYQKNKQSILPPNCANAAYYKNIGICTPDNFCNLIKNPVNYSIKKFKKAS